MIYNAVPVGRTSKWSQTTSLTVFYESKLMSIFKPGASGTSTAVQYIANPCMLPVQVNTIYKQCYLLLRKSVKFGDTLLLLLSFVLLSKN